MEYNKKIIIFSSIIMVLVIIITVIAIYKVTDNNVDNNKEKDNINTEKYEISDEEITKIKDFLNDDSNIAFWKFNYDDPSKILENKNNTSNIKYSLVASDYAVSASKEQIDVIYKEALEQGAKYFSPTRVITIQNTLSFLNERVDYNFLESDIRKQFDYLINQSLDMIVLNMGDTINRGLLEIDTIEKENNKIIIDATEIFSDETNNIHLILIQKNDNYYFYSCNISNN